MDGFSSYQQVRKFNQLRKFPTVLTIGPQELVGADRAHPGVSFGRGGVPNHKVRLFL